MADAQIYRDLKADHDKHRAMLKELGELSGDTAKRKKLFENFRIEIAAHAAAEEESLYATMLGNPDLRDDARHSVSEHKEVDDLIAFFLALRRGPGNQARSSDADEFRRRFDLMAVQRNLKALGTFGFQTISRANPVYIQYIPRTLAYVRANLERYPRFSRLCELLAAHVEELRQ